MLSVVGNPALDAVATEVNERFARGPQPSAETNASATVGKMISMRSGV